MTQAERNLLVYMASMLAARAYPAGEVAKKMQELTDLVVAERKGIEPNVG